MNISIEYREMTTADYDAVLHLWKQTPGVELHDADSFDGVSRYLRRNPQMSFVACADNKIIGTIMSGHDGKRGYVQHLAVDADYRRWGVGSVLAQRCIARLKAEGILKAHLMILSNNDNAKKFWHRLGWRQRQDIELHSFVDPENPNA